MKRWYYDWRYRKLDRLTSEERKRRLSEEKLKNIAIKRERILLENGWRRAVHSDFLKMKVGDVLRCCSFDCGCIGQLTRVSLASKGKVYHYGHDVAIACFGRLPWASTKVLVLK